MFGGAKEGVEEFEKMIEGFSKARRFPHSVLLCSIGSQSIAAPQVAAASDDVKLLVFSRAGDGLAAYVHVGKRNSWCVYKSFQF